MQGALARCTLKGELNLDKKVAVRLFVLYNNEQNSPRFNQFCVILKLS